MSEFEKPIKYTTTDDYVTIRDYFTQSNVEIIPPIKPYSILGATPNDNMAKLKSLFLSKISTEDRQQRALVSLAYPILCSIVFKAELPKYFKQISSNEFSFDADDLVIMALTGQCQALSIMIIRNRNNALTKSAVGESLLYLACRSGYVDVVYMLCNFGVDINSDQNGSTALHAATYFNHKDLAQFLIESGASINIKNKFDHLPIEEASKNLKYLFNESSFDPLTRILQKLIQDPIFYKLEHIFFEKEIVAYRIQRKINERQEIVTEWVRGWHGTKSEHLNFIFQYGLLTIGECADYITGRPLDDARRSDESILISTSVYCASQNDYAELLHFGKRGSWRVMIEVGIRKGSFICRRSRIRSNSPVKNDVDNMLVEIQSERETFNYDSSKNATSVHVKNGVNVVVLAAVLVKEDFLVKTAEYANSEKKSEKPLPDNSNVWSARTAKVILNGIDEIRTSKNSVLPASRDQNPTQQTTNPDEPSICEGLAGVAVMRPH